MNKENTLSENLGLILKNKGLVLVTAESCTAGLIASTVADTAGSSAWLDGGFIVYTPEMKNKLLQVSLKSIEQYNITSEQVAYEMAYGAIVNSDKANVSISVTGVAGPGGGSDDIPVGTVCFGFARVYGEDIQVFTEKKFFKGNRNEIRQQVVYYALNKLTNLLM
jgi:nicotinamide-nucleotide amidase